jgi:hypothetical protein
MVIGGAHDQGVIFRSRPKLHFKKRKDKWPPVGVGISGIFFGSYSLPTPNFQSAARAEFSDFIQAKSNDRHIRGVTTAGN